jgi:acyl CoA:acetate/3-ketoacid CoA transferase
MDHQFQDADQPSEPESAHIDEVNSSSVSLVGSTIDTVNATGEARLQTSAVATLHAGGHVTASLSAFANVQASGNVTATASAFGSVQAGGDISVTAGGGVLMAAQGNMTVNQGGGQVMLANGNMDINQGGGLAMIAQQATVRQGIVGVILSPNVTLEPGTRVLINTPQAIMIGTIAGVILSLFRLILPRGRR